MPDMSSGGEHAAYSRIIYARSVLAERRAVLAANPWVERYHDDVRAAERAVERALDDYITAKSGSAYPTL